MRAALRRAEIGIHIDVVPNHGRDQFIAHYLVANEVREEIDAGFGERDRIVVIENMRGDFEPAVVRFLDRG